MKHAMKRRDVDDDGDDADDGDGTGAGMRAMMSSVRWVLEE